MSDYDRLKTILKDRKQRIENRMKALTKSKHKDIKMAAAKMDKFTYQCSELYYVLRLIGNLERDEELDEESGDTSTNNPWTISYSVFGEDEVHVYVKRYTRKIFVGVLIFEEGIWKEYNDGDCVCHGATRREAAKKMIASYGFE